MISTGRAGAVTQEDGLARDWRSVWSWSATSAPVGLLLTAGILLGPQGINLLSTSTMPFLSPIVPVALAALGVLVGLNFGDGRRVNDRTFGTALILAALTMVAVSAGLGLLAWTSVTFVEPVSILAFAGGICAATSLTLPTGPSLEPRSEATRIIETAVLLPILAGALMLVWLRAGAPDSSLVLLGQSSGVTLALAAAGWLVLTRASSPTEERVFALSALLLIGGAAEAMAQSALFAGAAAGVFWRYASGRPRETIGRDVLFVQHPLLVLVLLVAGARVELSLLSLTLGLLYAALRTAGVILAGAAASRVAGRLLPAWADWAGLLIRPGVFGVAFALNAAATVGNGKAALFLTMVVLGTIASEFAAFLFPPRPSNQ